MRILVLGGTAFQSSEIARQAVSAGHVVTCLARGSATEPPDGVQWVKADRSLGANSYAQVAGEWDAEDWLLEHGIDYWAGPDSLPLWLPPGHEEFCNRSNHAARAAGMAIRPWQETLAATLDDERRRRLDRPGQAGLTPATEARLAGELLRSH